MYAGRISIGHNMPIVRGHVNGGKHFKREFREPEMFGFGSFARSFCSSEWRTCQLTAVTGSHLKPSCACLFMFFLLTWTCCSHLSSRGKLDSFWSPLCVVSFPVSSPFGCFLVVVDSFATERPHGCHFRTSSSFSVLVRLVRNLSYLFAISCCLSSGACWFSFPIGGLQPLLL